MNSTATSRRQPVRDLLRGARRGTTATIMMTGVFSFSEHAGWIGQLPPRQLIDRLFPHLEDRGAEKLTIIAHLAYGTLLGSGYTALDRSPTALRGALFGIAVCLANYEVALPLLGLRQPLHRDRPAEILTMATAHLVYGSKLSRSRRKAS